MRRSNWHRLPALGPGIAREIVEDASAAVFVRRARQRWGLSLMEALVLLVTLAGYTNDTDAARAIPCALQTVRNTKRRLRESLGVRAWPQAVCVAWTLYAPLRSHQTGRT